MTEDERYLPIRLSHLLRHCSVGAIVRGSNDLVVVPDTRYWDKPGETPHTRKLRYVDQVRSALNISESLCTPPVARKVVWGDEFEGYILVHRFPKWTRCTSCGLLHNNPWKKQPEEKKAKLTCGINKCRGGLEQVPWVLVHKDGYLADVPWHSVAHNPPRGTTTPAQSNCRPDWTQPYLKLQRRPQDSK